MARRRRCDRCTLGTRRPGGCACCCPGACRGAAVAARPPRRRRPAGRAAPPQGRGRRPPRWPSRRTGWPVGGAGPRSCGAGSRPATPYGRRSPRAWTSPRRPGAPVRAAAAGRVVLRGPGRAGAGVVSVDAAGTGDPPLRTTTSRCAPRSPRATRWRRARWWARCSRARSHCRPGCLHWGLLRGETLPGPAVPAPAVDCCARGPSRLLPVLGVPRPAAAAVRRPGADPADSPDSRRISRGRRAAPWRRPPR